MQRLIDRIEAAGYKCDAGPLELNQDWLLLKAELGLEGLLQPQPSTEKDDDAWRRFSRTLPMRNDHVLPERNTTMPLQTFDTEKTGHLATDEPLEDELYQEAVKATREIATNGVPASISSLQRRLRIGYNRAFRLMEAMEKGGVVGPADISGKRELLHCTWQLTEGKNATYATGCGKTMMASEPPEDGVSQCCNCDKPIILQAKA
jgi:hypothetical protein